MIQNVQTQGDVMFASRILQRRPFVNFYSVEGGSLDIFPLDKTLNGNHLSSNDVIIVLELLVLMPHDAVEMF